MSDANAKAVYDLTYAYGVQLRFNGMLLRVLIERGILTESEALKLLEDVAAKIPEGNSLGRLHRELLDEFPK